jgi:hypothetical protein
MLYNQTNKNKQKQTKTKTHLALIASKCGLTPKILYCASLVKECPQHHGHKDDPGVTPGTCVMFGEVTKVDLVMDIGPQALKTPPTRTD